VNAEFWRMFIECLGWALLHFVWQGLLVAALLAGGLRLLRNAPPNHRYLAGCLALLLLAAAPPITLNQVWQRIQLPALADPTLNLAPDSAKSLATQNRLPAKIIFGVKPRVHRLDFAERVERFLPLIVIGWFAGVLILSFRLLAGWLQIRRLKRVATSAVDEIWHRNLVELGRRLGMERPVRLLQSALVEVPTVIGWLRPVILLPASCLVGLSPAQLESILAHELAHIRRHDYLVNLLQSVVETFLFYHPAVWWISRRVREERELCCDDLAVEICGDRIAYARALATLEELRAAPAHLALAAGGAPLLKRIRRLAGQSRGGAQRPAWPVAGIIVFILFATLAVGIRGNRFQARAGEGPSASAAMDQESTNQTKIPPVRELLNRQAPPPPHTNLAYPGPLVHSGPGREAIMSKLNHIQVDSIQYDNVPLGEVINDLSKIAKSRDPDHAGINFFIDRPVPAGGVFPGVDPTTGLPKGSNSFGPNDIVTVNIKINHALHNLRLADALDAIVMCADRPIHYSVLEFAVKFESGHPPVQLETRAFHVDAKTFNEKLNSFAESNANAGNNSTNTGRVQQSEIRQFFTAVGVDWDTNNPTNVGKMIVWNDGKGILLVRSTTNDLALIESGLQRMNQPTPEVNLKVKVLEIKNPAGQTLINSNWSITNQTVGPITGILTPEQYKKALETLERRDDVDELNVQEITTESGRQAQFQIPVLISGTNAPLSAGSSIPIFLDVIASASTNGYAVNMTMTHSVVEFTGFDDPKKVFPQPSIASQSSNGVSQAGGPLPHYSLRQLTSSVVIMDGQTAVLGGWSNPDPSKANDATSKSLMLFITPTLINPDGTRFHESTEDSTLTNGVPSAAKQSR